MTSLRILTDLWRPLAERLHIFTLAFFIAAVSLGLIGHNTPIAAPPNNSKHTTHTFELSRAPTIASDSEDESLYVSTQENGSQSLYESKAASDALQQSTNTSDPTPPPAAALVVPQSTTASGCSCSSASVCPTETCTTSQASSSMCERCLTRSQFRQSMICSPRCAADMGD